MELGVSKFFMLLTLLVYRLGIWCSRFICLLPFSREIFKSFPIIKMFAFWKMGSNGKNYSPSLKSCRILYIVGMIWGENAFFQIISQNQFSSIRKCLHGSKAQIARCVSHSKTSNFNILYWERDTRWYGTSHWWETPWKCITKNLDKCSITSLLLLQMGSG